MKICRVTIGYPPRRCGWSHHAFFLSKYQSILGNDVFVFHPEVIIESTNNYNNKAIINIKEINIRLALFDKYWGNIFWRLFFLIITSIKIIKYNTKYPFDIIHGHGDILEAVFLRKISQKLGVPLIMTIHSGLNHKWRYRAVAPRIWRQVDGIIAVSPAIARELEEYGVSPERLLVQSSGVELSRFAPADGLRQEIRARLGLPESAFVVSAVGRLTPMKGFGYLVEAVRQANLSGLEVRIIGDGPVRQELQAMAKDLPSIRFTGALPHQEVLTYLQASDLFALPSVDLSGTAEGTPTAVMEAMAVGLPILTTDSGGAQEVIEVMPGVTMVPQGDSGALAQGLTVLSRDAGLRKHLGESNRKRVEGRDWPRVAKSVCQFYQKISNLSR